MRLLWLLPVLFTMACLEDDAVEDDDEAEWFPEGEPDDPYSCDVVDLRVLGPDVPIPGDQWTIWLTCDGATLTGPTVIRFDPENFADLDNNIATFSYAGTALFSMQVGAQKAEMDVTVYEADTGF